MVAAYLIAERIFDTVGELYATNISGPFHRSIKLGLVTFTHILLNVINSFYTLFTFPARATQTFLRNVNLDAIPNAIPSGTLRNVANILALPLKIGRFLVLKFDRTFLDLSYVWYKVATTPEIVFLAFLKYGSLQTLVYVALGIVTFVYDTITLAFYTTIQIRWLKELWEYKQTVDRIHPAMLPSGNGLIWRSATPSSNVHKELMEGPHDTMEKIFKYAIAKNRDKPFPISLGTRRTKYSPKSCDKLLKEFGVEDYDWNTYTEVDRISKAFSKGLLEMGLASGDRLAFFAESRTEWLIAAIAAFRQNITVVLIDPLFSKGDIVYALNESEVQYVFTSAGYLHRLKNLLTQVNGVKELIVATDNDKRFVDTDGLRRGVNARSFDEVYNIGNMARKGFESPLPHDVAVIAFTLDNHGSPKGVVYTHRSLTTAVFAISDAFGPIYFDDVYIGYLPLCHTFELLCETVCFVAGVPIGYSSPDKLLNDSRGVPDGEKGDISLLRPTLFAATPAVIDRVYNEILKSEPVNRYKRTMFKFFTDYKSKWNNKGYDTPLVNHFIFNRYKMILGGKVRVVLCGGPPLGQSVLRTIETHMCCPMYQGYVLTEPPTRTAALFKTKTNSRRYAVPLDTYYMKLVNWGPGNFRVTDSPNPRGEILLGGKHVADGYLNDEANDDFFEDDGMRWYRTGDVAEAHPDGRFHIIGRTDQSKLT